MNQLSLLCISFALAASVYGGPQRVGRQGWGTPSPTPGWGTTSGWGSGWEPSGTSISEEGESQSVGQGSAIAEHASVVTVTGNAEIPGLLSISTGSGVSLSQGASNYQQTQINNDGSSYATQGNTAYNHGSSYDYLGGDAQGINVDVISTGWSAVEGEGAVGQSDGLNHQGPGSSGWSRAPSP